MQRGLGSTPVHGDENAALENSSSLSSLTAQQPPPSPVPSRVPHVHVPALELGHIDAYEDTRQPMSMKDLTGLFAISFSYGFVYNSLQSIVIPREIELLVGSRQSMWLGMVMAAGAFCQLSAPIVGSWSDRTGKRMPFLVHGSLLTIIGITLFICIRYIFSLTLLFIAFMVTTVGLSVQYAIMTSLLSDCVVEEQVGTGSGIIATLAMLGSGCGYSMFAFRLPMSASYFGYMMAIVTCLCVSLLFLPASVDSRPVPRRLRRTQNWLSEVVTSLIPPNPYKHPDFLWACIGRCLFNGGLSGQVYLVYYFRDVVQVGDPPQVMSYVAVMALIGGIMAAIPSGVISDRIGKKPVVYLAIALTVTCLAAFMVAQHMTQLLTIGLLFGMGNVAYLSVDYAIGVQTLPRDERDTPPPSPGTLTTSHHSLSQMSVGPPRAGRSASVHSMTSSLNPNSVNTHPTAQRRGGASDAAKDLGIFAMAATLGNLIGQLLYGGLLHFFQTTTPLGGTAYRHSGYILLYSCGAMLFFFSGVSTKFISDIR